jgi:hypothetical protein
VITVIGYSFVPLWQLHSGLKLTFCLMWVFFFFFGWDVRCYLIISDHVDDNCFMG